MAKVFDDIDYIARTHEETRMPEAGTIYCAHCGHDYTRQVSVDVFVRSEDAREGNHVHVSGDSLTADRDLRGNPSRRRSGMFIDFECESDCDGITRLRIVQHKGVTYFDLYAVPHG